MENLTPLERRYFLDDFRTARAAALADSEGFEQVLFAVERLGSFLLGKIESLGKYHAKLAELAGMSPLAHGDGSAVQPGTGRFDAIFWLVRNARNEAMHQGSAARQITTHCVELALILEDALMATATKIEDLMVGNPLEAKSFEQINAVRRTMLMNAFSYLPYRSASGSWSLISDAALTQFLRAAQTDGERKGKLAMTLAKAIEAGLVVDAAPATCVPADLVASMLNRLDHRPMLVLRSIAGRSELVGLVTASDLL